MTEGDLPRSSLLRDLASTSVVQLLTIGMNAVSLAVIARRLGVADLGIYTLQRRAMSLLQPVALLGLTVAVPRYIAGAARERSRERNAYAVGGLAIVLVVSGLTTAAMLSAPRLVGSLAFGDPQAVALARALAGFVFATAAYLIVYSVFRGWVMVGWANLLELLAVGALPLGLALVGPRSVATLIWVLAGGMLLVATAFAALGLHARLRADPGAVWRRVPKLLRFGLARTPGDLAIVGLFSIGPLVVVHVADAVQAGYASIVQSSLNLVAVAAVPLGALLLPRAAADHAAGEARGSHKYRLLWSATVDMSLGLAGLLIVASPLVMNAWLPNPPDGLVDAQRIAALGIPGYIVYLVFRSYLDATNERPYSSYATLGGLAVLGASLAVGLSAGLDPLQTASLATALALSSTGLLIWRITSRELELPRPERCTALLLAWLAGGVVATVAIGDDVVVAAALTTLASASYVAVVAATRPQWATALLSRLPFGSSTSP